MLRKLFIAQHCHCEECFLRQSNPQCSQYEDICSPSGLLRPEKRPRNDELFD